MDAPVAAPVSVNVVAVAARAPPDAALIAAPFVLKDIRVEGLQRVEPGTIFASIPVRVGRTTEEATVTGLVVEVGLGPPGPILVIALHHHLAPSAAPPRSACPGHPPLDSPR